MSRVKIDHPDDDHQDLSELLLETLAAIRRSPSPIDLLQRILDTLRANVGDSGWNSDPRRRMVQQTKNEFIGRTQMAGSGRLRVEMEQALLACPPDRFKVLTTLRGLALGLDCNLHRTFHADAEAWFREHGLPTGDRQYRLRPGDPVPRHFTPRPGLTAPAGNRRPGAFRPDTTEHLVLAGPESNIIEITLDFRLNDSNLIRGPRNESLTRVAIIQPKTTQEAKESSSTDKGGQYPAVPLSANYPRLIFNLLQKAGDENCELAILPEGTLSESTADTLMTMISEREAGLHVPDILIAGTLYRGDSDHLRNEAEIWVSEYPAKRYVAAIKNTPAAREPICWADPLKLRVFFIGNLKLAVVICADFDNPWIQLALHHLDVERVLVPAYSLFAATFNGAATSLTVATDGAVVLANGLPDEVLGFVAGPSGVLRSIRRPESTEHFRGWSTANVNDMTPLRWDPAIGDLHTTEHP